MKVPAGDESGIAIVSGDAPQIVEKERPLTLMQQLVGETTPEPVPVAEEQPAAEQSSSPTKRGSRKK